MLVLHTTIAIAACVLLIIRFKIDPVISLVVASLYLGLAGGVGFPATVEAITKGFGNIMTSVGLLIGFGVLIGALLHTTGAFTKMVTALLRCDTPRQDFPRFPWKCLRTSEKIRLILFRTSMRRKKSLQCFRPVFRIC